MLGDLASEVYAFIFCVLFYCPYLGPRLVGAITTCKSASLPYATLAADENGPAVPKRHRHRYRRATLRNVI